MSKKSVSPQEISTTPDSLLLIGIPEAARRMSTTVFAVRELCRSGELPYLNIGHRFLISPDAIRTFIKKREQDFLNGRAA